MSQRETIADVSLQQWKGVNQRLQPTLVPDGFFSDARGIFFGYGENAERMPGKLLAGVLNGPVLSLFSFDRKVIVQTLDTVWMVDSSELTDLDLTFMPLAPPAPVLSGVTFSSITATAPASFPLYTTSFTLQRSLDNVTFATLQTGMGLSQAFVDNTVADDTLYYYRLLSVSTVGSTAGPSASATTPPIPPTFLRLTELNDTRITEAGDYRVIE